jgi:predicted dehydrogenase
MGNGRQVLRVGVVGLRRGLGFVRLLQAMDGVDLVGVADQDSARLEQVCREHDVAQAFPDLEALLGAGLDCVVIATPLPLHVAHATAALAAGVHVLAEVPALGSIEECDALIAAVERSGRQYMLAENCCYWAVTDAARALHRRGDFGELFSLEAEYIHNIPELRRDAAGAPTWRAALEPIVYCTHSLGPLLWISGAYPVEVTCYSSGSHFDSVAPDLQVAILKLDSGGVVRITCSFANAHWTGHRFTLFGTRASLDTGWIGRDEPRFWTTAIPHLREPIRLPLGTDVPGLPAAARLGGHGTAEWQMVTAFCQAIREGSRPPIDVYDAVMYSLPGLLAAASARAGRPLPIPQYQQWRPGGAGSRAGSAAPAGGHRASGG